MFLIWFLLQKNLNQILYFNFSTLVKVDGQLFCSFFWGWVQIKNTLWDYPTFKNDDKEKVAKNAHHSYIFWTEEINEMTIYIIVLKSHIHILINRVVVWKNSWRSTLSDITYTSRALWGRGVGPGGTPWAGGFGVGEAIWWILYDVQGAGRGHKEKECRSVFFCFCFSIL